MAGACGAWSVCDLWIGHVCQPATTMWNGLGTSAALVDWALPSRTGGEQVAQRAQWHGSVAAARRGVAAVDCGAGRSWKSWAGAGRWALAGVLLQFRCAALMQAATRQRVGLHGACSRSLLSCLTP